MDTPQDFIEFPKILQRATPLIPWKSFRFDAICKGYPSVFQWLPRTFGKGGGGLGIHRISWDSTLFAKATYLLGFL